MAFQNCFPWRERGSGCTLISAGYWLWLLASHPLGRHITLGRAGPCSQGGVGAMPSEGHSCEASADNIHRHWGWFFGPEVESLWSTMVSTIVTSCIAQIYFSLTISLFYLGTGPPKLWLGLFPGILGVKRMNYRPLSSSN